MRSFGAVILGYIAMIIVIMVGLTVQYLALGTEGAFKPDSFEASNLWNILSLVWAVVAAWVGTWVCVKMGLSSKPAMALAILILVLGIAMAIPTMTAEVTYEVRTGDLTNMEAMNQAIQPLWIALVTPVVGAVTVYLVAKKMDRDANPS